MLELKGIGVSQGIAIAKAYCLTEPQFTITKKTAINIDTEKARLADAVNVAKKEIEQIRLQTEEKLGAEHAAIFSAHLLVLADPELMKSVEASIEQDVNAEYAVENVTNQFITMFESMDNVYMRERAADIRDVKARVLKHLLNIKSVDYQLLREDFILLANDLTPSMTAQLDPQYAKGFVTEVGGRTSHSAILARTLEIPAVVGVANALKEVRHGQLVIIDGINDKVLVNPSASTLAEYEQIKLDFKASQNQLKAYITKESISQDGVKVELAANIGTPADLDAVLANGAEAIGLFRTEFLYMERSTAPTEDEQYITYKAVLEKMAGKPVVVRTLDVGGDKEIPYLQQEKEMNPFLGYRAIRLCLAEKTIFSVQLRALLRASVHGNLKIMFPMIATLDEFRAAKELVQEITAQLRSEGIAVAENIAVGMMVEIPSAAILADQFAKEADFLSIGTNDLIQYTLAADRMNQNVAYLYQPYHPAVLRLIKNVIDAAHANKKWAGMCGEMAGDKNALPILLALGLDEFSMSASSILQIRERLSQLNKKALEKHITKILNMATSVDVENYITKILANE